MRTVQDEAAVVAQAVGQIVDQARLGVDDVAAGMAHDVDVVVLGRPVGRRAVSEVGMAHQAELLEQFERPVDRRHVDISDRLADLFGRGVTELAHCGEHLFTLSRDSQTAGSKLSGEIRGRGARVGVGTVHRPHRR